MRALNRLTARGIAALNEPGFYADGGGLYLRIDQTLAKRWVFVFFWRKKRREMGLGSLDLIDLKAARAQAEDGRQKVAKGIDPIEARRQAAMPEHTFAEAMETAIALKIPEWKTAVGDASRSEKAWRGSLGLHAAKLLPRPVAAIADADVLEVLQPLWLTIPETARRVRMRIEYIIDLAIAQKRRDGPNPARWHGHLEILLSKQSREVEHHEALPYERIPGFMTDLRQREAIAAKALEYTVLAVSRTGETLGAKWAEDEGNVWVIPGERMKAGKEHRVPITPPMRAILDAMRQIQVSDFIFPGDRLDEPLSGMAMLMLLRRMKLDVTVHGFRSTFRDWAGDMTEYPRELVEQALAHNVGNKVERAYRRRDALERRRAMMLDWAAYCAKPANNVTQLFA